MRIDKSLHHNRQSVATHQRNYVPTGMESVFNTIPKEETHDIYSVDGRLIRRNATISEALNSLPKGIYIINGCKVVKE